MPRYEVQISRYLVCFSVFGLLSPLRLYTKRVFKILCRHCCFPPVSQVCCGLRRAGVDCSLRRKSKNPTAKLLPGQNRNSAVPPCIGTTSLPHPLNDCYHSPAPNASLRPRLLDIFRLGPQGPILSGSVPAGITPPPTLSESVTRFLPFNGLIKLDTY